MDASKNHKKVMVAGHVCLDITPSFQLQQNLRLNDIMLPGKLIHVGKADIHPGGAVANTGLAMKLLGADVRLVAKIGEDAFGQTLKEIFTKYDSGNDLLTDSFSSTSYSIVIALPGNDRLFLHDPGANNTFFAADISDEMIDGIDHFHFGYPPLMHGMFQNNGRELITLFQRVKQHGITTSLDMAAIDPNSPAQKADWKGILHRVLPFVDFFVPSIEETCFMLDRPRYEEWNRRAHSGDITGILNIERDIRPLAEELIDMGAGVVLLKCGALGMYYRTADSGMLSKLCDSLGLRPDDWCAQDGFEASYLQENIVSGTGAGDTSIAAFLIAMLDGRDLKQCMQLACATGACCISAYDALSGLEPLNVLKKRIDDGWAKEPLKPDNTATVC
jgi:sugar/nucleoside kinase (ribokinase family)